METEQERRLRARAYAKAWRDSHKDRAKEYARRYYLRHRDKILERSRSKYNSEELKKRYQENREELLCRLRVAYRENPDKFREYQRRYRELHRDQALKTQKRYRERNKEKVRERARKWYLEHRSQSLEKAGNWWKAHKDKEQLKKTRRRARKEGLPDSWTQDQRSATLLRFLGSCAYCGVPLTGTPHWDHFIPLSSPECPGTVSWNMLPACRGCNSSKGDSDAKDWLQRFPGKFKELREYLRSLSTT